MKKTILIMAIALATFSMKSCKSDPKTDSNTENSTETVIKSDKITYSCPMDCEKGKTYAEAGKCPICNMDLLETTVGLENHKGHDHENHEGHDH